MVAITAAFAVLLHGEAVVVRQGTNLAVPYL